MIIPVHCSVQIVIRSSFSPNVLTFGPYLSALGPLQVSFFFPSHQTMNTTPGTVGSDPVILATAGYDHTVRFWQAHSGICTRTVQHQDSVSSTWEQGGAGQD